MGYLKKRVDNRSKKIFFKRGKANALYFDLIIHSLTGYDLDYIEKEIDKNDHEVFLNEYRRIVLVRISNILSFQIKNSINLKYLGLLKKLLFVLINDLISAKAAIGADFAMIEIYFALTNIKSLIKEQTYNEYISLLRDLNPYECYAINCRNTSIKEQQNFVIYNIVGEYLRSLLTGFDAFEYINENWEVQKTKFNNSGMYKDPNNPMVYDLSVRAHLALMLQLGYKGKLKREIEDILIKSSMITLHYISTAYVFPYGGRSNSYNMNEALHASLCEYYANVYYKKGEYKIAGAFKNSARKSIEELKRYKGHHIKNFFDIHSNFGCEKYGTYEGYMVTTGCFMEMGYTIANKKIKEYTSPSTYGQYIFKTTDDFHKVFANNRKYFIEIDYNGDLDYEGSGLGRIHKKDIPIELALSMPFSNKPKYKLGEYKQEQALALGIGWYEKEKEVYLAEQTFIKNAYVHTICENKRKVSFKITYYLKQGKIIETYTINKKGVHVKSECDFAKVFYHIPILINNGKDTTVQKYRYNGFKNYLLNYVYEANWDNNLSCTLKSEYIYNRSGIYKSLIVKGISKNIAITFKLKKERTKNEKTKKAK